MKSWKSDIVRNTLSTLCADAEKNIPVFLIIEGKEKKIYPIDSIGSNQKCIVIRAFADESRAQEEIKEMNDDRAWLERIERYRQ